ncbi:hypothetical protein [Brevundimonas subvibrioides]|uniref:Uncharacterized protein n=1 Tax=Brevundimonas subvibrioides (strain ATCC 15264 / DSM 4735 / LMG 14903 / NBRC 16000 / CB 81) TaxID=633149 RepID=D9QG01_BRESC|nr:hypothetical protein [Brevundimonas subvibrioides]ADL00715.1 hypothetical protein Bresu_1403 [Brevundimonas subvibrioides ATCC 15264]
MDFARTLSRAGLLAVGLAIVALLLLSYWTITGPARNAAKKAEAAATIADGRTQGAQDASVVRDANDAANASTLNTVKDATDEVRRTTDPAERDAVARRRLCNLNPGACPR